ncbi:MAG: Nre family DNA repair protein [Candidatus Bathyarchaeota archaeon]|nr:Nre family DNA repair protein [Candidatus Bathyarchaeota archaeon]MDH5419856.1 Nre family DNA repair protein [Candidatus Bathyarchaeota archaeon]MDH5623693.1 Nre family DNA repair protein [Candidatus Bathyarchaeota archaeon]MDH5636413.1 Nre family DNA repair protein [Candidatus Bathyarchaeota archaeon]MDH5702428.1 Nre family DNA repair protein [Candidatus Bathyarchaeota archaeon]
MRKLAKGKRKGKIVGHVRKPMLSWKDNPWILQLLDPSLAADLNYSADHLATKAWGKGLCVACKGGKFLCGKTRCPLVVRLESYFRTVPLLRGTELDGASPPGVFVGRIGYPYVYAGPLVPPVHEDTSLYDLPEFWFGKSIDEIVGFRSLLVRGKHRVHVKKFEEAGKIMDRTRELALSVGPVDVELILKSKPSRRFVLDDEVQPFGPSAVVRDVRVSTSRWDHQIEKAYYDSDLKAAEAVTILHEKGVLVTKIQRAFSVGTFGLKDNRRLVPTRWSITAVDSIVSKDMIGKIKTFPEVNEYRVYESRYLDNRFEVLMIPGAWSYEAMEAWYPGTVWNPSGTHVVMFSDWEGFDGRTTYADIGGCYYAARLAVGELLVKERRQAVVIVLREAHPGYIMPVGVWQVRENVRNAVRQKPLKYNTLEEALTRVASQFQIPLERWIERSRLLRDALFQRRITDYLKG